MLKSSMPNIPGIGPLTETFDFVKNLWGGMSGLGTAIPGMVMPTLSVEEVDKQIKDLKAVESWLNVNMNMLRSTIQALEVQSATLKTLRTMGDSFNAAVSPEQNAWTSPFSGAPAAAQQRQDDTEKNAGRRRSRDALKEEFRSSSTAAEPAAPSPSGSDGQTADPALWWNQLQEQFKQAVSTAMAPEAMVAAAKAAMPSMATPPARSRAKPAGKTAAKSAAKKPKRT